MAKGHYKQQAQDAADHSRRVIEQQNRELRREVNNLLTGLADIKNLNAQICKDGLPWGQQHGWLLETIKKHEV